MPGPKTVLLAPDNGIILGNDNKVDLCDICFCKCCPDAEKFLSNVTLCASFRSNDLCNPCFECVNVLLQLGGPIKWMDGTTFGCGNVGIILICQPDPDHNGCNGYKLYITCNGEMVSAYPTFCSCAPFVLEYDISIPSVCCDGSTHVRITFGCPSFDCSPGTFCCCKLAPAAWQVRAEGFTGTDYCTCGDFNGVFVLPAVVDDNGNPEIGRFKCTYRSAPIAMTHCPLFGADKADTVQASFYWELVFQDVTGPGGSSISWRLNLIVQSTDPSFGRATGILQPLTIFLPCFDCLGSSILYTVGENNNEENFGSNWCDEAPLFSVPMPCCGSLPAFIELEPAP